MYIEELQGVSFRSYSQLNVRFGPGVNVLVGSNGVGKTSVLDMVYYLSMCKSSSRVPDASCIRHGDDRFAIGGRYEGASGGLRVGLEYVRGSGKTVEVDGVACERLREHIGRVPLVAIYPQDTDLISDGGDLRRRFMNAAISQYDGSYLVNLARYERVLQQRNRVLKGEVRSTGVLLDVLDGQLVEAAEGVYAAREAFCRELAPRFQACYSYLAPAGEAVSVEYRSQLCEGNYLELLAESRENDYRMTHTTVGVHRDSMHLTLNGYAVRREGSQGQQKSFIVALRLALYQMLLAHVAERPLLLLDDIFDRLDGERMSRLVAYLGGEDVGQVLITDTDVERVRGVFSGFGGAWQLYEVSGGSVQPIGGNSDARVGG